MHFGSPKISQNEQLQVEKHVISWKDMEQQGGLNLESSQNSGHPPTKEDLMHFIQTETPIKLHVQNSEQPGHLLA